MLVTFEECEAIRQRVSRGDGLIGILPVETIRAMARRLRELGQEGRADAWSALGHYHVDDAGLDFDPNTAAECAARAVALGSLEARPLLQALLPHVRGCQAAEAHEAYRALGQSLRQDPDGSAHYLLGLMSYHGHGCEADPSRCFQMHERSAALGNADAMFELHLLFGHGLGTAVNSQRSMEWLIRAAERGHHRACYNLGAMHATGDGMPLDEDLAMSWYEKSATAGNGEASANLGIMWLQKGDQNRAQEYLQQAAEQGFDVEGFLQQLGMG